MATTTAKKTAPRTTTKPKAKVATTRAIEQTPAPSPAPARADSLLWASIGITGFSIALKLMGKKDNAAFAGRLAAQTLLFGIYKKIIKR